MPVLIGLMIWDHFRDRRIWRGIWEWRELDMELRWRAAGLPGHVSSEKTRKQADEIEAMLERMA